MTALSYAVVRADGSVFSGTDFTGQHESAEQMGDWYRRQFPDAVEVQVWAGELADQPQLFEAVA